MIIAILHFLIQLLQNLLILSVLKSIMVFIFIFNLPYLLFYFLLH